MKWQKQPKTHAFASRVPILAFAYVSIMKENWFAAKIASVTPIRLATKRDALAFSKDLLLASKLHH